ncbi:uncharacterized protein VTP21DRAFT_10151 [Calcarisporiella thermophila]|uniref:uncharacterized protein n=1 Tax=Calcarisporiella thermophila TaxID=911321 RepID=UPI0037425F3E
MPLCSGRLFVYPKSELVNKRGLRIVEKGPVNSHKLASLPAARGSGAAAATAPLSPPPSHPANSGGRAAAALPLKAGGGSVLQWRMLP